MLHGDILELLDGRISVVELLGADAEIFLCDAVVVDAAATAGRAFEAGNWTAVYSPPMR